MNIIELGGSHPPTYSVCCCAVQPYTMDGGYVACYSGMQWQLDSSFFIANVINWHPYTWHCSSSFLSFWILPVTVCVLLINKIDFLGGQVIHCCTGKGSCLQFVWYLSGWRVIGFLSNIWCLSLLVPHPTLTYLPSLSLSLSPPSSHRLESCSSLTLVPMATTSFDHPVTGREVSSAPYVSRKQPRAK